jgi:hypothetical protein
MTEKVLKAFSGGIVRDGVPKHYTILTPRSNVLLEKLTVAQLFKTFRALYGTQWFITVFKKSRHWALFWTT